MEHLPIDVIPSEDRGEDTRFSALPYNKFIPKPPFTALMLGIIGSGKSSLIYTMLNNWYKNYYDEVIIYSGVIDANESYANVKQKKVLVLNEWNEADFLDYFKKLEADQMKRKAEKKPLLNVCIVMDDMITQNILSRGRSTSLERFVTTLRHFNASLLMSSQSYKLLSRTARMNMLYLIIMSVNDNELGIIAEEHSGLLSPRQFSMLYKKNMLDKKYVPFIIDYKAPPNTRFRVGFENVITIDSSSLVPTTSGGSDEEDMPTKPKRKNRFTNNKDA
jgi:hypothetical protein